MIVTCQRLVIIIAEHGLSLCDEARDSGIMRRKSANYAQRFQGLFMGYARRFFANYA